MNKIELQGLKYKWVFIENTFEEKQIIQQISLEFNISLSVSRVIFNKGIRDKDAIANYLFPTFENFFYQPSQLKNADHAVDRILQAIKKKEKILIFGDYDVDGVTSTSLLLTALKELGAYINFYLPHRVKDGYGISRKIIEKAKKNKYDLIITVDNGTCAFDALKAAFELNIDVIVTDHHKPQEMPIGALCIVNPHQELCSYPFKGLAGVGVIFKIVYLLYTLLGKKIPNKIYELYAIGTIADLVPLINENRYLLKHALKKINKNTNYAIQILKKNAQINEEKELTSENIAFSIAPQINALGRIDDPRNGVIFFVSDEKEIIENIGKEIAQFNKERKKIEAHITHQLLLEIKNEDTHPHQKGCIIKSDPHFSPGIIGIVAARLNQEYCVPTCIFVESSDEILKGSCRSIPQCDIFSLLNSIDKKLLISFGGHHAAAGVSIAKKNLAEFEKQFSSTILASCTQEDFNRFLSIDDNIELDDLNTKLWNDLNLLEPFGSENKMPLFCIHNVLVSDFKVIKDIHIKVNISSVEKNISIIFFNRTDIIQQIKKHDIVSIVGKVIQNEWNYKKKIEMNGIDMLFKQKVNVR